MHAHGRATIVYVASYGQSYFKHYSNAAEGKSKWESFDRARLTGVCEYCLHTRVVHVE